MEHLVRFTTAEGRDGHHYAENLDEALKFVERLRNTEEASDVRVFRLREVPIEFRAYYKVEVRPADGGEDDALPEAPVPAAGDDAEVAARPPLVASVAGDVDGDNASRRLFQRG